MTAAAVALAVLGWTVAGPARWLAVITAAVLVTLAWARWRSVVLCGPAGLVVRQGLGSRFVPWTSIAHVEARRLRGCPGLQVVLDRHDGTALHLRAISGGLFLERLHTPAYLAGWLSLELAWATSSRATVRLPRRG